MQAKPNPKLDSAQFFYQSSVLSFELSNCGQLLTGSILSSSPTDPFLDWFISAACWVSLFLRWPNPVLDSAAFGKSVESAISATCWYKCSNLYACKFSTCGESLFMASNKTLLSFKTPMLCGQVKSADCNSNCQKHPPTMAGMFNDQSTFMYRPIFLRVVVLKAN